MFSFISVTNKLIIISALLLSVFFSASIFAQDCQYYRAKYNCPSDTRFKIHLSFDDSVGSVTPKILDILKQEKLPATFFVLGNKVNCQSYQQKCQTVKDKKPCASLKLCKQRRQTLERMKQEGHLIGSHSYEHYHHSKLSPSELEIIIKRSKEILQPFFTTQPAPFRLPYGDGWFNQKEQPQVMAELKKQGFTHIGWKMSGFDWDKKNQQGTKILDNIMNQMCPGRNGVVLLHDGVFENEHKGRVFTANHLAEWIPVMRCVADFVPLKYFKKELKPIIKVRDIDCS